MRPRRTTPPAGIRLRIKDVAERAGLSTATISRALTGRGRISPATRQRVLAIVRKMDYHPNWLARGLRRFRTDTVGLVLPDIENMFFTALLKGVEQAAAARGWNIIVCNTDEEVRREEALVRTLVERQIDGLLLCPTTGSHAYLTRYVDRRLPMLAVNRAVEDPPLPSVLNDNEAGAYEIVRHLYAGGARRLALILGLRGMSTTEDRLAGCRRAVRDLGLGKGALVIQDGQSRMPQAYEATLACLTRAVRPDAIFAFNSLMTEAALRAIHDKGLRCPEDVALVGFDNFRSAAAFTPPLSMVEQYPLTMGTKAVEELAHIIATGAPSRSQTLIATTLIVRASSLRATRGEDALRR